MITNYKIRMGYKIWLELYDELGRNPIIGEKKIELLKEIEEIGSIQKASENLELDFKKAHEMLNDLQNAFTTDKLFTSERGRQGGTSLTLLARNLIAAYDLIASIFDPLMHQINDCLQNDDIDLINCLTEQLNSQIRHFKKDSP